jgi:DNA-binding NtrC family response regulator
MSATRQESTPDSPILRVVAIDDDEQHLKFIAAFLSQNHVEVFTSTNPQAGLALVQTKHPHLVIVDLMMPDMTGMEILEKIMDLNPAIEVLLLTGDYSAESAVQAIQKGACDYLTKPLQCEKLQARIDSLLADLRNRQRCVELENALADSYQFAAMVGRSIPMLEMFRKIRRVAQHFRTVLITGETGTGKELVAKALHESSPVASGPFVTCNCSTLVEGLAESELFGHVKGAFTGAFQDRTGIFESANGGTVFLDEVGELSPAVQAKLLRVLQNQEIQRVGSPVTRKIDARVIAATHRDLRSMIDDLSFREDLFYRLSMVHIEVPSLMERKDDLPLLQNHFLRRFSELYGKPITGLTRRAVSALTRYAWPGNIREMENVLGNACMMTDNEEIDIGDLPEYIRTSKLPPSAPESVPVTLQEVEKAHALRVLASVQGNKLRAAEMLGISRAKLYRILSDSDLENAGVL